MDTRQLFNLLGEIHRNILRQVPYPTNRIIMDILEGKTDPEERNKAINDLILRQFKAGYLASLYQYLNEQFQDYCTRKNFNKDQAMPEKDRADLIDQALTEARPYLKKLVRGIEDKEFYEQLERMLDIHKEVSEGLDKVCRGQEPVMADHKMDEFLRKEAELTKCREVTNREIRVNSALRSLNVMDENTCALINKTNYFIVGAVMDRLKVSSAYCEEYACLALKKIFNSNNLPEDLVVEKCNINYGSNGHTFLAINRKLKNPANPLEGLKDIANWGKGAMLYDPWADMLIMAEDFDKLSPDKKKLYHMDDEWMIDATFKKDDTQILNTLIYLDICFEITGLQDMKQRIPMLLEEYQLTPLDNPELGATRKFIEDAFRTVKPDKFDIPVKFYITAAGNEYVGHINGFEEAAITIHKDFLSGLASGKFTLDEFRFALGCEIHYLMNHGIGICNELQVHEQNKIDESAVTASRHGPAAVSYLRNSHTFSKQESPHVRLPSYYNNHKYNFMSTYETRIKNLMTALAKLELKNESTAVPAFNPAITEELKSVNRHYFFRTELERQTTRLEKIELLTTLLPNLRRELLPIELTWHPSIRLRDYTAALRDLAIDLNNPQEAQAADILISSAYNLRIPGFDHIYYAALKLKYGDNEKKLAPLGMLRQLQKYIDEFGQADSTEQAETRADSLLSYFEALANLFRLYPSRQDAMNHVGEHQARHNRAAPTGRDRYFAFNLGRYVDFKGLAAPDKDTNPWQRHLALIPPDQSSKAARVLFILGVNRAPAVWKGLRANDIYNILETKTHRILDLEKKFSQPYYSVWQEVLYFISSMHTVDDSMFASGLSFEAAYQRFYDAHLFALMSPGIGNSINIDNVAVDCLMRQFTFAALSGTPQDKEVVKSFFRGRPDSRDLGNLRKAMHGRSGITSLSHYYRFVINQIYKRTAFKLFTPQEQREIVESQDWHYIVPALHYLKLYELPFTEVTFECLTEFIQLLKKSNIPESTVQTIVYIILDHHIKQLGRLPMLSTDAIALIKLDQDCHTFCKMSLLGTILKRLTWELPDSLDQLSHVSAADLALVYRCYDSNFEFPSPAEQDRFTALLTNKINALLNNSEKIAVLEILLFEQKQFTVKPLSRIQFVNTLITTWTESILVEYGRDDGTDAYFEKIKAVVDRACDTIGKRDLLALMSGMADKLQVQQRLAMYIGTRVAPDKFLPNGSNSYQTEALGLMGKLSEFLGDDRNDLFEFLQFISKQISAKSLQTFAEYVIKREKENELASLFDSYGYAKKEKVAAVKNYLALLYHLFWDRPLEERCVILDYILIPAKKTTSAGDYKKAYDQALEFIAKRLFKRTHVKGSDDDFAFTFLKSYLDATDEYQRSLLLAGLLVASNKGSSGDAPPSPAKILAMLCEHLGPAYIKFAQAIHSHPGTPEDIRRELDHVKGRANPPYRWNLLRHIYEVLPREVADDIEYVDKLIGSASYNYAVLVKLKSTGKQAVLSIQRENARKDTAKGFKMLKTSIEKCPHERLNAMRPTLLSMLNEAEAMSELEMDHEASKVQYEIANEKYRTSTEIDGYRINIFPTTLIRLGKGFRIIELINGTEFNDLPETTLAERRIKNIAAKAVYTMELENILSGKRFDSDRHGNQLRIEANLDTGSMEIGVYDFGEMALENPSDDEIAQLAAVFGKVPKLIFRKLSFTGALDAALSEQISVAASNQISTRFLMRVRKALLALQDFNKHLSNSEMVDVLLRVMESKSIHPLFRASLTECVKLLNYARDFYIKKDAFFSSVDQGLTTIGKAITDSAASVPHGVKTVGDMMSAKIKAIQGYKM